MRKKMWRCKSCGRVCDGSNTVCPDCGLDLGFYGEIQFVETGEPEPSPSSASQPQEQAEPVAEEESRPEIKEEHEAKERKPEKKSKRGKVLIAAGVVLLVLLGLGGFMTFRKVDGVGMFDNRHYSYWNSADYVEYHYAESGSNTTQEIRVHYSGFWGPWQELTVTSSDSSVVKVVSVKENAYGSGKYGQDFSVQLEAGKPGTATITATAGDESKSYQISVYQITGMELDVSEGLEIDAPEELEVEKGILLGLGDSVSYTAKWQYTGKVDDETNLPKVEVTSSDTDIVEVDSKSGTLIAKEYGAAVITASAGEYVEEIYVSVSDATAAYLVCYDLLVDGDGKTMYWIPEGLSVKCGYLFKAEGPDAMSIPYTVESSDEKVLSVHEKIITAEGPGTATVTFTTGNVSDSLTLEVYPVDRSSGSWVEGSIQTIAAPAEESSSRADYKISIYFGNGVSKMSPQTYFGTGGTYAATTGWEVVEGRDRVQAREGRITLQGSKWEQKRSIAGITFIFNTSDREDFDFNPATDIMGYWVVYTDKQQ